MTAIAALRTDEEIVVAAAGREIDYTVGTNRSVNKIVPIGPIFIATRGISIYGATKFNLSQLIDELPQVSVTQMAHEVVKSILPSVVTAIEHIQQNHPPERVEKFCPAPLQVVIAGKESNALTLYYLQMTFPVGGNPAYQGFVGPPNKRLGVFLGSPEGTREYDLLWIMEEFSGRTLIEFARDFVQSEIDRQVPETGPPIDILRITHNGPQSVQHK